MIFLLLACFRVPEEPPEKKLMEASEEVIFASVEELGPHVFIASINRQEFQGEDQLSSHDEVLEIRWKDWDNFSYVRMVDERPVTDILVVDRTAWRKKKNGTLSKHKDAEPFRIQMTNSWNMWDQIMAPFQETIEYSGKSEEEVEGRKTQRYALSLDSNKILKSSSLKPFSLNGNQNTESINQRSIALPTTYIYSHPAYP